jgi:hypothetical protein
MGLKAALKDPEVRPIFILPVFWTVMILLLILTPMVGEFIISTWFVFGALNVGILMWASIAGRIGFDGLVATMMVASIAAGPIGTGSMLSIAVYLEMQIREEIRRREYDAIRPYKYKD